MLNVKEVTINHDKCEIYGGCIELSSLLKELGWSKTYLADHIGVSRETVSRWNEPPKVVILLLQEYLKKETILRFIETL